MIRLFFLIRSLERGGAELQLIQLVRGLDKARFAITVATFYDGGALRPELAALEGVRLVSLGKRGRWDLVPFLRRLVQVVRATNPQIVHGYLGVANELGLLAGRLVGARVVWGLRASHVDFSRYGRVSALTFRVGAWLSRFADLIIVNSSAGKAHHIAQGYRGERMVVIPNGIDTERFVVDVAAGRRLRNAWGVGGGERLVGLVARLDPMKDHPTFLRAAARLVPARPDVRFVCVGDGPAPYRQELRALADELGLGERLRWAGPASERPAVYNALDVATSTSFGEGFPNVVGEAMACGVPCVVTDVGDSAAIAGDTGRVVPPRDPTALANALGELLDLSDEERLALGRAARERIVGRFSVQELVRRTTASLVALVEAAASDLPEPAICADPAPTRPLDE